MGDPTELVKVMPFVDILSPNEPELQMLSGKPTGTDEQVVTAARSLMSTYDGLKVVLVTLGERGAMIVQKNSAVTKSGVKVKAIDTVGAGDAFLGSFAHFYAIDGDLES